MSAAAIGRHFSYYAGCFLTYAGRGECEIKYLLRKNILRNEGKVRRTISYLTRKKNAK